MKKILSIAFSIIFICSNLAVRSQTAVAQRQPVNERTVPKLVLNTFNKQYPDIFLLQQRNDGLARPVNCQE